MAGDSAPARMLARTWTIAANYRSPADYDVPTAPTFDAEKAGGTLVLRDPDTSAVVLRAERPRTVRR